jgi:hypothetical protein
LLQCNGISKEAFFLSVCGYAAYVTSHSSDTYGTSSRSHQHFQYRLPLHFNTNRQYSLLVYCYLTSLTIHPICRYLTLVQIYATPHKKSCVPTRSSVHTGKTFCIPTAALCEANMPPAAEDPK